MRPAAATVLLGLAFIAVAASFDAEPLYVVGVAFVVLAGGAAAWVWFGVRGLTVERSVGAARVLEDRPVAVDVVVRSGPLGLPSGAIEDDLLPVAAPLPPGRRATRVRINARFARRGRKTLGPPHVVVRDPFGLAERVVVAREPAEVLVLPRLEPVESLAGDGAGSGLTARRSRTTVAAEVDLDGLRPLREGASASRIYWPALARGGELLERRLRAEGDTRPLVVLDPRAPAADDDLDAAVRAAGSLCVHLARAGGCALLLPGDRRPTALEPSLAGWSHLHVRLALVDARVGPHVAGLSARRGPVFYVAARATARPPRALAHAPGGGRIFVVPATLPGRRALVRVAGCMGYEVSPQHARMEVA
jgi:uncharacterized protein (DUF58 family)